MANGIIYCSPNIKVLTHYLLPVLIVAIATSIPRFLEMTHAYNTADDVKDQLPKVGLLTHTFTTITWQAEKKSFVIGQFFVSLQLQINVTTIKMEYNELRFDKQYIMWYQNGAKLLVTGKSSESCA